MPTFCRLKSQIQSRENSQWEVPRLNYDVVELVDRGRSHRGCRQLEPIVPDPAKTGVERLRTRTDDADAPGTNVQEQLVFAVELTEWE